jgi:tetratricopeptide (TPR) repeat protein
MKPKFLLPFVLACLCSAIAVQSDSDRARDQVNKGLQDVKQYHYESAIERFRFAHQLDPQSREAALYLAGALALNYVPGIDAPDNLKLANEAVEVYKQVLALDPRNITALKDLASLEFNMRKFEEAKSHYLQAIQIAPDEAELFYEIGVMDWVEAYRLRADERSKRGLSMAGPPSIAQPFCAKLRAHNLPVVEDGIQMMKKALELRPDFDDAMAYLNLLYRERADIQCNNRAARANDEHEANQWVDKAMEVKKRKAEAPPKDSESPAERSPESMLLQPLMAPPPPPPPPPPRPKR